MHSPFSPRLARVVASILPLVLGIQIQAAGPAVAKPSKAGISPERLERIDRAINAHIQRQEIAGAVTLVARHGQIVYHRAFGKADVNDKVPMQPDSLFRIASMTKPITSIAVMILHEEGRFRLNDPISRFIPEFKNPKVLVPASKPEEKEQIVPAKSEITIRQLLTHTSGIGYRFAAPDPWGAKFREAGVVDGLSYTEKTTAENVRAIAAQPLLHHPGERFTYGLNTDVLGYLVEVVSGQNLEQFCRERLFEPLQMRDTHFQLPREKLGRLAKVYSMKEGKLVELEDKAIQQGNLVYSPSYPYEGPVRNFSGGAGLVSSARDYFRFLQMLLNGGELDGRRILSPKTVQLITANHIGEMRGAAYGFGLGFGVVRDVGASGALNSPGVYDWSGFWYTTFFVDPKEKLIGISMAQLYPSGGLAFNDFYRSLVYQSVTDSLEEN